LFLGISASLEVIDWLRQEDMHSASRRHDVFSHGVILCAHSSSPKTLTQQDTYDGRMPCISALIPVSPSQQALSSSC
jgi:hypothetical protein